MAVSVKNFTQLVNDQVTAIQGVARQLIDFSIGSVLRSLVEGFAGVVLFLQAQALQVAALTRAATSFGADLDSYYADFGFTRLPATGAAGLLTFSRFTPSYVANLPVGTTVQTFDGAQSYVVTADQANAAYNAAIGAYVFPANVSSVTVPAVSIATGGTTNAVAGTITQITSNGSGADQVTNALPFAGGADAEADQAFRSRFVAYLGSLSRATRAAILYAVSAVQQGLTTSLVENQNYAGATQYGNFYAVVDDGSGAPPTALLNAVSAAVEAVRPFTVTYSVFPPSKITASVAMTLTTGLGYTHAAVAAAVSAALSAYINALPLGTSLPYSRLAQIAYDTSPGVLNVTAVTLNGATIDLAATNQQVIRAGTMSVA